MKAKQINKIIDYGIMVAGAYFVGSAIAGAIKRKKEGVGKVEHIKRRIYKEVSLAQDAGVDFSKKYAELTADEKKALEHVGKDVVGWKQSKRSIESGKPYTESYFGSLRRAWNAVSGIDGIGRAYNVKDANGNICLTWIEDAAAHVESEAKVLETEERAAQARKRLQKTRRASVTPIAPAVPVAPIVPQKDENYERRLQFANMVWNEYRKENPYFDDNLPASAAKEIAHYKYKHAVIADAYARNAVRVRNTRDRGVVVEVQLPESKDWKIAESFGGHSVQYAKAILDAENNKNTEEGFAREDLDDLRRALLDRAKHMHVSIPKNEDWKEYEDLTDNGYTIRGDNRYKVLGLINWILWMHYRYERGGDVYYPKMAYATKEDAMRDTGGKMKGNGFKIIPIWEVPVEKITGIGYAPEVEAELYEIWREQIEYGETEYDYDTWRKVVGDEYAKDVLKYMR